MYIIFKNKVLLKYLQILQFKVYRKYNIFLPFKYKKFIKI